MLHFQRAAVVGDALDDDVLDFRCGPLMQRYNTHTTTINAATKQLRYSTGHQHNPQQQVCRVHRKVEEHFNFHEQTLGRRFQLPANKHHDQHKQHHRHHRHHHTATTATTLVLTKAKAQWQ